LNVNRLLYKLDRASAWTLYLLFMLMMVSGYMMTRGFISYRLGVFIHFGLDAPTMILLSIHTAINMRWILMRRGVRRRLPANLIPILFGLTPLIIILYLNFT